MRPKLSTDCERQAFAHLHGCFNSWNRRLTPAEQLACWLRFYQRAKRIAYNDVLPAQRRYRHPVAFREIPPAEVSRQENVRPRTVGEVRLIHVARRSGCAFVDIVGRQGLRTVGKEKVPIIPGTDIPLFRRTFEGSSIR